LIAGPVVGVGAGLIGAVHRFTLGGFTQVSCSLATVLAGLIGGLVFIWKKDGFTKVTGSALTAVFIEIVHGGLALLIARPFDKALEVVIGFVPIMIVANGLGMAIYSFIIINLAKERDWEKVKQTIEGELGAAREIQMSMVPKMFPPFPDRTEFQLNGTLISAKEVGGDFYDFFFVDDSHLVFLLGDVSGKGVPASLFMAVTKTLLKSKSGPEVPPDEILRQVNVELCRGNDATMFATVFCAILNTQTGEVVFSSAGHNPPLLTNEAESRYLQYEGSMALGVFEDSSYEKASFIMKPGETLIVYTDGVTEAMSADEKFFSEDRLIKTVQECGNKNSNTVLRKILDDVQGFAAGAPQSDDITLLVLQYIGQYTGIRNDQKSAA